MKARICVVAVLATLLIPLASVADAASGPVDVTWGIPLGSQFTFDEVVLTPDVRMELVTNGPYDPSRRGWDQAILRESGSLGMTVFMNDGVPTAVPAAAYPAGGLAEGVPYSLTLIFNGEGYFPDGFFFGASNAFNFNVGMFLQARWCPDCGTQLNPVASAPGQPYILDPLRTRGTLSIGSSPSGNLSMTEEFTLSFIPWGPPFGINYWVSPDLSIGTPVISVALTGPVDAWNSNTGLFASMTNGFGNLIFLAPVPEPDTYALLLAGLALLGFAARRRSAAAFATVH